MAIKPRVLRHPSNGVEAPPFVPGQYGHYLRPWLPVRIENWLKLATAPLSRTQQQRAAMNLKIGLKNCEIIEIG